MKISHRISIESFYFILLRVQTISWKIKLVIIHKIIFYIDKIVISNYYKSLTESRCVRWGVEHQYVQKKCVSLFFSK